MKTTTTVHWNKEKVAEDHILRNEELCSREAHIDYYNEQGESIHAIIFHKGLAEVYDEEFGDALGDYNGKQKRKDRQMSMADYMKSVEDDNRGKAQTKRINGKRVVNEDASRQGKQLSYEITVKTGNTYRAKDEDGRTIYDGNNHHIRPEELPRPLQKRIIYKYADGFQDRNPNFRLVNICYHGDEGFYNKRNIWEYSEDHLHIEFVPIAHGFKRGLTVQNSMNKAMLEMGFDTPDCYELWAKKEQEILDEITRQEYLAYCEEHPEFEKTHGELTIYHPVAEKTRQGGKSKEELAREEELNESIAEVEHQRKIATKQYNKALSTYQLYDAECENIEEYKQTVDRLKCSIRRKITELESADLNNEFFRYLQRKEPEEYEKLKRRYSTFKSMVQKNMEVPEINAPNRVDDDGSNEIRVVADKLKSVIEEYDGMLDKEQEIKKERNLIRRSKGSRDVPEINSDNRKNSIEESLDNARPKKYPRHP